MKGNGVSILFKNAMLTLWLPLAERLGNTVHPKAKREDMVLKARHGMKGNAQSIRLLFKPWFLQ